MTTDVVKFDPDISKAQWTNNPSEVPDMKTTVKHTRSHNNVTTTWNINYIPNKIIVKTTKKKKERKKEKREKKKLVYSSLRKL